MTADNISDYIAQYSQVLTATQATGADGGVLPLNDAATRAAETIRSVGKNDGKVMLVANGGSAAVASHMHNDISKACGIRALVFTETPLLTALSNDNGYESAYETATHLWAQPDDLLIAISSSGRSENILRAARAARSAGTVVITLSGFEPDNPLRRMGDLNFYVQSGHYGLVETSHAAISHYLTDAVAGFMNLSGENA